MQENREQWIDLFNGFPFLGNIFSKREWLNYGLKFEKIYGDFGKASDALYYISAYYQYINLLLTEIPNRRLKSAVAFPEGQYKKYEDVIMLIMAISLVEKLSSKIEYLTFDEWIKETKSENENVIEAWRKYNEEFGCSHKFRIFFISQNYLTKEQKLNLLRSITYGVKTKNSDQIVPLFCYSERCGERKHECMFSFDDCNVSINETALRRALKEFANFLYELRNRFVHNAFMFQLADTDIDSSVYFYFPYQFKYIRKPTSFDGWIFIKLSVLEFKQILNSNFKKLLENYISSNARWFVPKLKSLF